MPMEAWPFRLERMLEVTSLNTGNSWPSTLQWMPAKLTESGTFQPYFGKAR